MFNKLLPETEKVWIFQCNPSKYEIHRALSDNEVIDCFHWRVKQYKDKIVMGHLGLIWCSGNSSGIYAIAELISNPGKFKESDAEKKYWINDIDERGTQFRIKMKLIRKLVDDPIMKNDIIKINGLQDLSILRMPRGTNFPVRKEEWALLKILLDN